MTKCLYDSYELLHLNSVVSIISYGSFSISTTILLQLNGISISNRRKLVTVISIIHEK